jgi:hypothetical protein
MADRQWRQDAGDYMSDSEHADYLKKKEDYKTANPTDPAISKLAQMYKKNIPGSTDPAQLMDHPTELPLGAGDVSAAQKGMRDATGYNPQGLSDGGEVEDKKKRFPNTADTVSGGVRYFDDDKTKIPDTLKDDVRYSDDEDGKGYAEGGSVGSALAESAETEEAPSKSSGDDSGKSDKGGGMMDSVMKLAPLAMMLLNKGGKVPNYADGGEVIDDRTAESINDRARRKLLGASSIFRLPNASVSPTRGDLQRLEGYDFDTNNANVRDIHKKQLQPTRGDLQMSDTNPLEHSPATISEPLKEDFFGRDKPAGQPGEDDPSYVRDSERLHNVMFRRHGPKYYDGGEVDPQAKYNTNPEDFEDALRVLRKQGTKVKDLRGDLNINEDDIQPSPKRDALRRFLKR